MTPARRSTILLAAVALVLTALQPAALGTSRKDYVRHADMGCLSKSGHCVTWRLWLRSGRVLNLTDARPRPFVVSPHGAEVAYVRRQDGALVVRDVTTGKVRAVPGMTWPPVEDLGLRLSPGGRFAAILSLNQAPRVVDTITGEEHTFPFTPSQFSFSPDNKYVLAYFADRAPGQAVIYSTRTWTEVRRGGALAGALSMDGITVADIGTTGGGVYYLRIRNVVTGAQVGPAVKLPAGQGHQALVWDRAGHLDILLLTKMTGEPSRRRMTLQWRRVNEGMRLLDTFTASGDHSMIPAGAVFSGP